MKNSEAGTNSRGLSGKAVVSFLVSLLLCSLIISMTIINRSNVEKLQMEQLILEKTLRISEVISKLLYKTEALAAVVIQGNGEVVNFDILAPSIADNPAIANILLAPNGVVSNVYPPEGNEAVIGLDFFGEGIGNKEAMLAKDTGRLVLGGPFDTVQGYQALVGRLPVYLDTQTEKRKFWGIVSVGLKFPQALNDADLGVFKNQGFSYELWRINPDTNTRQVILQNQDFTAPNSRFVEKPVSILNSEWTLKVWPIRMWFSYPENLILILAGFSISLLVLFVMQNNHELNRVRASLEDMAKTDPLTGIFNRRYFMEMSYFNIERARRHKAACYIIIFDIDKFKNVNDAYGHTIGDKVLKETTSRIKAIIRPYDLFARYGGEEFIIFVTDIDRKSLSEMGERLRSSLSGRKFIYDEISVDSSASFGVAQINDSDLEKAINQADEALYRAKRNGRDRVAFYDETDSGPA